MAKAKTKTTWELDTWGIYTHWDRESKELPEFKECTHEIPARLGIEFGYVLKIRKGKGKKLQFRIEHPPFPDSEGRPTPPFTGEIYIRSNDWEFFLGDTVWEPVSDKIGAWRLVTELEGTILADETFMLVSCEAGA